MKKNAELEALAAELLEKLRQTQRRNGKESLEEPFETGFSGATELADAGHMMRAAELARSSERRLSGFINGEESGSGTLLWQHGDGTLSEEATGRAEWAPILSRQALRELGGASIRRAPRRATESGCGGASPIFENERTSTQRELHMTAESLSEAFCRDARRYDGGFEKY